jgi:hypothetical protein
VFNLGKLLRLSLPEWSLFCAAVQIDLARDKRTSFFATAFSSFNNPIRELFLQWVETNQSNFCIYLTDIRLLLPHGTKLTAYADVRTDVSGY